MKKLYAVIISVLVICSFAVTTFAASFYIVQPGDMLWQVAKKFNTTYQEIAKVNNIKDANLITVGQKLTIPEAAPAAVKPATPAVPAAGAPPAGAPPAPAKPEVLDGFRVITIGTSGPPMSPNSTWPATLVQFKDKNFLVDVGGGATHGLMKAGVNPALVKNMLFTHHHADHDSDYFTFAIGGWNGPAGRRSLNLVGPAGTEKLHDLMMDYYKEDLEYRMKYAFPPEGLGKNVFVKEIKGSATFVLDGVKITAAEMTHTAYTLAYKFEADGKSVVVSGDTTFSANLIALAKGADILVMDAHVPIAGQPPLPPAPKIPELPIPEGFTAYQMKNLSTTTGEGANLGAAHATMAEIAKMAKEAGVKKLVLTHLPPAGLKIDEVSKFMKENGYNGQVIVSETLGKYLP